MSQTGLLKSDDLREFVDFAKHAPIEALKIRLVNDKTIDRVQAFFEGSDADWVRLADWTERSQQLKAQPCVETVDLQLVLPQLALLFREVFFGARANGHFSAQQELNAELTNVRTELAFRGQEVDQARADLRVRSSGARRGARGTGKIARGSWRDPGPDFRAGRLNAAMARRHRCV